MASRRNRLSNIEQTLNASQTIGKQFIKAVAEMKTLVREMQGDLHADLGSQQGKTSQIGEEHTLPFGTRWIIILVGFCIHLNCGLQTPAGLLLIVGSVGVHAAVSLTIFQYLTILAMVKKA